MERNPHKITIVEVFLYIWIAAFACDEFGEFRDAGTLFYAADFWSLWDIIVIAIGVAFLVASKCEVALQGKRIWRWGVEREYFRPLLTLVLYHRNRWTLEG